MKKPESAFTIIEIIVVLIILAVIVASGTFLVPLHRLSVKGSQKIMALNFARETMEEFYWDPNITDTASTSRPLPAGALNNASNTSRTYTITTDGTGNYRIITVTVHWD